MSVESGLEVQLEGAEEAALHADLATRVANLLALVDWLAEQAAGNSLPGSTRHELLGQVDRWLAQLGPLVEEARQ